VVKVCDYEATNGVHWEPDQRVAGGLLALPTGRGIAAWATRSYCSATHRNIAERGTPGTGRAVTTELGLLPDLADGKG
jgi:hypothetical protein